MKKLGPSLIGVCLAVGACAQQSDGFLGTKVSGSVTAAGAPAAGPGIGSFIQMVLALGIVLILLKTVIPKLAGKMNKKLVTNATSTLTIEETANFAGGTLYIVRARSKTLLLSVASTGVTCLSDLTETGASPEAPSFQELVEEAPGVKPAAEEPIVQPESDPANEAIATALKRLERLAR